MKHIKFITMLLALLIVAPTCSSQAFRTQTYKKKKVAGGHEAVTEVEYPVAGNPALLKAVRAWMKAQFDKPAYTGAAGNGQAFVDFYARRSVKGRGYECETYDCTIKKVYEDENVVSFECSSYYYSGGAHGMPALTGATFLKSNGSQFRANMIDMPMEVENRAAVEGLMSYVRNEINEDPSDTSLYFVDLDELVFPESTPWLVADGVRYQYGSYEVMAFAFGMPYVIVPYSLAKQYATPAGLKFMP